MLIRIEPLLNGDDIFVTSNSVFIKVTHDKIKVKQFYINYSLNSHIVQPKRKTAPANVQNQGNLEFDIIYCLDGMHPVIRTSCHGEQEAGKEPPKGWAFHLPKCFSLVWGPP